jgi:hypothetical protein
MMNLFKKLWQSKLAGSGALGVAISLASMPTALAVTPSAGASTIKPQSVQAAAQTLPDGVYVYGQSPQPNQIGKGYFVFETKQGKVMGALYMPSSSFDCAAGSFQADKLALQVIDSYDRSTNSFDIALERTATVAASTNPPLRELGLEGFYKLDSVSESDRRMLNICKTDLQKK